MARPYSTARTLALPPDALVPVAGEKVFGFPARGFSSDPEPTLEAQFARNIEGFMILDGAYTVQDCSATIGTAAATGVMAVVPFIVNPSELYLVRFTTAGVDVMPGVSSSWTSYTGPALTGGIYDHFSWAGWSNKMLFTNGIDGLFVIDFALRTYTKITAAPAGARFVTVLGKRVLLSGFSTTPHRIQWSVKSSYSDWTSLGSGFEDMLASPGGFVDIVQGVHPYADSEAWVLRADSIWVMAETGYADAPFSFQRRHTGIGVDAPYSATMTPHGLFYLSRFDVIRLTPEGFTPVGTRVRSAIFGRYNSGIKADQVFGAYNARYNAYCLLIPTSYLSPTASTATIIAYGITRIFAYHIGVDAWTKFHSWTPRRIVGATFSIGGTFDQLSDTFDNQVGPMDSWGVTARTGGLFYAHITHNFAGRDVTEVSSVGIVHYGGGSTITAGTYETPFIHAGNPYKAVQVQDIEFLYQHSSPDATDQTIAMYTSRNPAAGWNTVYSSLVLPPTSGWKVKKVQYTTSGDDITFRFDFTFLWHAFRMHSFKVGYIELERLELTGPVTL